MSSFNLSTGSAGLYYSDVRNRSKYENVNTMHAGIGSEYTDTLDKIKDNLQSRLRPYIKAEICNQEKISAWSKVSSSLKSVNTMAENIKNESNKVLQATPLSSFSVTTTPQAIADVYQIKVCQLAESHKIRTKDLPSDTEPLAGKNEEASLSIRQSNGEKMTLLLNTSNSSLQQISDAINQKSFGVLAKVIPSNQGGYYLSLTASKNGLEHAISVAVDNSSSLDAIFRTGSPENHLSNMMIGEGMQSIRLAKDAIISIDNIEYCRPDNRIKDILPGVILNLNHVTEEEEGECLRLADDNSGLQRNIQLFCDSFNLFISQCEELSKYDDSINKKEEHCGILMCDNELSKLIREARTMMNGIYGGMKKNIRTMNDIGIMTDPLTGKLTIDNNKLYKIIDEDAEDVKSIFISDGNNDGVCNAFKSLSDKYNKDETGLVGVILDKYKKRLIQDRNKKEKVQSHIDSEIKRVTQDFRQLEKIVTSFKNTEKTLSSFFDNKK